MSPTAIGSAGAACIQAAFASANAEGRVALVPYVVAGYPDADTSFEAALACIDNGADLLEVGLPYSDPLADGATLQRASSAALKAGALKRIEELRRAPRSLRRSEPRRLCLTSSHAPPASHAVRL